MDDLTRLLLERADERTGQVVYGVATGLNTVAVRGAATAVELPALTPVVAGDYCAVWESGADRLILGPVGGVSGDITGVTAATGWGSVTLDYCRRVGPMMFFRVTATRTGGNLAAGNIGNESVCTLTGTGATGTFTTPQPVAAGNNGPTVSGIYQANTGIVVITATATGVNTSDGVSFGGCVLIDA